MDFHGRAQAKSSIDEGHSDVLVVEQDVRLTFLVELQDNVDRRSDCISSSLPYSTFTTSIHNWIYHVEARCLLLQLATFLASSVRWHATNEDEASEVLSAR